VIDIEQRSLGAFEKDSLSVAPFAVEQRPNRIHIGQDARRDCGKHIVNRLGLKLGQIHPRRSAL